MPSVEDPEALYSFAVIQRTAVLGLIADLRTCTTDLASSQARVAVDVEAFTAYEARVKLEIAAGRLAATSIKIRTSHPWPRLQFLHATSRRRMKQSAPCRLPLLLPPIPLYLSPVPSRSRQASIILTIQMPWLGWLT